MKTNNDDANIQLRHLFHTNCPCCSSDLPGVPSSPTASDVLATSLKLHWNAPAVDGGTPVIGYHVERRSKTSMHWVFLNRDPVVGTSFDVRDLFEDTTYEFRVTAVNKMGAGKPSDPSKPITARNPWSKLFDHNFFAICI
jgi:titin